MTPRLLERAARQGSLAVRLVLVLSGGGAIVTLSVFASMKLMELSGAQQAGSVPFFGLLAALFVGGVAAVVAGRWLYGGLIGRHRFACFACGEKAAMAKPGRSYDGIDGRAVAWDFHCERCGRLDRGGQKL